jgi:hypothetical protein
MKKIRSGSKLRIRKMALGVVFLFALLSVISPFEATAQVNSALNFDGTDDYVTFGQASGLGVSAFTLEVWFTRTGTGVAITTGTRGIASAVPLLTKGRGEADNSNKDMNFFLGINTTGNTLAADFEEGAGQPSRGLNHPVNGSTPIALNTWYHAAVTYDGFTFRLYLQRVLDGQTMVGSGATPVYPRPTVSTRAALASALTSTGAAAGYFAGVLDEARVWNVARTQQEIQNSRNLEITSAPWPDRRWG